MDRRWCRTRRLPSAESPADAAVAQPAPDAPEAAAEPVPFEASGEVLMFALANLPEMRAAMPAAARYVYRTSSSEIRIATGTTVVDWTLPADGRYDLRLTTTAVGITVLELLSQGSLGDFGLAPQRRVYSGPRICGNGCYPWRNGR